MPHLRNAYIKYINRINILFCAYIGGIYMDYVIAVYRSRNVSMRAYNYLVSRGVTCALVSTPRAANQGCGLSVKFSHSVLKTYGIALSSAETFAGFFAVTVVNGAITAVRI